MKDFRNKVVVITGAGSGMGRSYALAFAREGAHLALNDYNRAALDETCALLQPFTATQVVAYAFDVSDRATMLSFAEQVKNELGPASVVINNAGIEGAFAPTWKTDITDFERVMNINFYGVLHGTQAFLPQLLAKKEGALVNVSSIFGLVGSPNSSDYCASKFAVRGFTEALMVELSGKHVSVHLVHPGGVATGISQHAGGREFAKRFLKSSPDMVAEKVIAGIRQRKARIVCGKDSFKTWMAAMLVPQGLLSRIIWREVGPTVDIKAYHPYR